MSKILLPLLDAPLDEAVSFKNESCDEATKRYMQTLQDSEPDILMDRDAFINKMADLFDKNRKLKF